MSSSSSSADADAVAAIVALFDQLSTGRYFNVAVSVFFIYDAFTMFHREVACFWAAKRTGASLLFLANKGISMTLYVMALVSLASFPSEKSCSVFSNVTQAMNVLQFVPGAVFSALRAYTLSRSKVLGLLVFALSLAPVGANLVHYFYQFSGENFPPFGCSGMDNTTVAIGLRLTIISRAPLISADILLIYITYAKLSSWDALRDIGKSKRLSLSDILFRGGTIYFAILFVLNVIHLVLTVTAVATNNGRGSLITAFTAPITAILISRFLLALQEANQTVVKLDSDDPLHSLGNPFDSAPSFISSLGGFITPAFPAGIDTDEDSGFEMQGHSLSEGGEEDHGGLQAGCAHSGASSSTV